MNIHEVDTTRRADVNRFIDLPFELYKDTPQWVPQIRPDARLQLNRRKNPFYEHNDAAFFIAEQDGQDVGRIAVLEPAYFNDFKGLHNAHFYLFETVDDREVAEALFEAAAGWAQARSLNILRGPLGFMALDGFGMLAAGFEHRPALGIPYNHAYYPRLTEGWDFEVEERVYSGYVDVKALLANFPERVLEVVEKVKQRYGFHIKTMSSKREIRKWAAPRLADLYNRTLTHIAGDTPLADEELSAIIDSVILVAKPELLKFVMKDDELIGFLFCFLNISTGIQRARGRLFPFGLLHMLRDLERTDWLDLNGMGILPEYQGMGGTALMYAALYEALTDYPRFKHAEVIQISEFNTKSLNEMKRFGVDFYKTHHIYRRPI